MRTELCGILPAVASPCDENDRFLEDVFAEHLASLYRARIRGVYVCGSTGDGKRMRLDDRKRAAQIAVEVSKEFGGKVLLHVGAETTRDAVELSEHGAEAGVDIVSSLVPNNCSHSDILSYYTDIAKASSLPILAYHIPILSSRVATFEEVLSVLDIEHVMGIKISQWDLFFLQRVRWARPDLVIFSGYDEFLCPGLLYGADGGIGMWYNMWPDLYVGIYEAVQRREVEKAMELQSLLNAFVEFAWEYGINECFEYTLQRRGVDAHFFRRPRSPWSDELLRKIGPEIDARMQAIDQALQVLAVE